MFNGPFVDILIFAVLAIFLIFRLRSILGRREGFEEDPNTRSTAAFKTQSKPDFNTNLPSGQGIDAVLSLLIRISANRPSSMGQNRYME